MKTIKSVSQALKSLISARRSAIATGSGALSEKSLNSNEGVMEEKVVLREQ